jgi:hypothetical protein
MRSRPSPIHSFAQRDEAFRLLHASRETGEHVGRAETQGSTLTCALLGIERTEAHGVDRVVERDEALRGHALRRERIAAVGGHDIKAIGESRQQLTFMPMLEVHEVAEQRDPHAEPQPHDHHGPVELRAARHDPVG